MTKKKSSLPAESVRALVFVAGEFPMVHSYAELCAGRGYAVVIDASLRGSFQSSAQETQFKFASSAPANTSVGIDLTNMDIGRKKMNVTALDRVLPPTAPILTSSVTVTASEQATWIKGKHRLVGVGAFPTLTDRPVVEVAPTVSTPRETLDVVARFFKSLGKEVELVQDRIGMVLPRILCQLVNESMFAVMEDIASPSDIDTAMKLGLRHPHGPIEWGDRIGLPQVHSLLRALEQDLGEDRYRAAPLLTQLALNQASTTNDMHRLQHHQPKESQ